MHKRNKMKNSGIKNEKCQQKSAPHRSAVLFPPPPGSSARCSPPTNKQSLSLLIEPEPACTGHRPALYLPRALKLLSSTGSSKEEERCENAELRSEAVWTRVAEALVGGTGVVGWGLRNPVRLSRGTVVTDATVTSPDLTWGFMWFLLEGERKNANYKI